MFPCCIALSPHFGEVREICLWLKKTGTKDCQAHCHCVPSILTKSFARSGLTETKKVVTTNANESQLVKVSVF